MTISNTKQTWLVQSSRGDLGPFSLQQLQQLASRGSLNRSSLLHETKSTSWIRADQIPSIFDIGLTATTSSANRASASNHDTVTHGSNGQPPAVPKMQSVAVGESSVSMGLIVGAASMVAMVLFFGGAMLFMFTGTNAVQTVPTNPSDSVAQNPQSAGLLSQPSAPLPNSSANALSTEDLVTRTKESVAQISTPTGSGSGFVVADGVVATNYHVIADCDADSIQVLFPDGKASVKGPMDATLIAEAPERDLALLRIDRKVPKVDIDMTHTFRRGQDIVIIGSPGVFRGAAFLPNAVTKGVLSSEVDIQGYNHYQLSLPVNSGNSGGPVFGMDARVIGVVVSKSLAEDSISFCIPAADLVSLINEASAYGFKSTGRVVAEHDARVTINALTSQVIKLNDVIGNISSWLTEELGRPAETIPAGEFVQGVRLMLEKKSPELIKDYSFQLKQIVDDDRLTSRQRSEVETLQQRHRALKKVLDEPPPNVRQLTSDLKSLRNQFLTQLTAVNRLLQLGKPGEF